LLLIAAVGTAVGVIVGALVGMVAAYRGRRTDLLLMRLMDVLLAFPQLVLVLLLVSIMGAPGWLIAMAVALAHVPQVARVIRSASLDVCQRDFIGAAELNGRSRWQVITGEITPNITTTLLVESGLRLTFSIIVISGLNFLGFGAPPPDPSWGTMINENRIGLTANPWAVVVPVALIAVLTIGINLLADSIAHAPLRKPVERSRHNNPGDRKNLASAVGEIVA
jgi:peptide/nickel transport system permease protein